MNRSLLLLFSLVLLSESLYAGWRQECRWRTNRWGDSYRVCRDVYYEDRHVVHHHHSSSSDLAAGIVVGAVAVSLAESCAPATLDSNISTADEVLNEVTKRKEFADAQKFNGMVLDLAKEQDLKVKMDGYFKLVGVKDANEIAYFLGARKNELGKYAKVLSAQTELDESQAMIVVAELSSALKGSL